MLDRRASERVATSLLGTIVIGPTAKVSTCLIRDLSAGGARLWISGALIVPDRFDLCIQRHGITRSVELRWRTGDEVGVAFSGDWLSAPVAA